MTTLQTSRNLPASQDWEEIADSTAPDRGRHLDSTQQCQPEICLPENPTEWRRRVRGLIAELRRTNLNPSRGHLYAQNANGDLMACIKGVINDMAIEGGVPATWVDMEIDGPDEEPLTVWEVMPPETDQSDTVETTNRALPEALPVPRLRYARWKLCHRRSGLRRRLLQRSHQQPVRRIIWRQCGRWPERQLGQAGVNPLPLAADILEHLMDKPLRSAWHRRINAWADRGHAPASTL